MEGNEKTKGDQGKQVAEVDDYRDGKPCLLVGSEVRQAEDDRRLKRADRTRQRRQGKSQDDRGYQDEHREKRQANVQGQKRAIDR